MPDLKRKPKTLISAMVATASFFPSDEMSADVIDSSPWAGYQYPDLSRAGRGTDLESDFGNKSSSLRLIDLKR